MEFENVVKLFEFCHFPQKRFVFGDSYSPNCTVDEAISILANEEQGIVGLLFNGKLVLNLTRITHDEWFGNMHWLAQNYNLKMQAHYWSPKGRRDGKSDPKFAEENKQTCIEAVKKALTVAANLWWDNEVEPVKTEINIKTKFKIGQYVWQCIGRGTWRPEEMRIDQIEFSDRGHTRHLSYSGYSLVDGKPTEGSDGSLYASESEAQKICDEYNARDARFEEEKKSWMQR